MKKTKRTGPRQAPGPEYKFTLDDLQRMVEQMGGRFQCQIYPKELDETRLELERLRLELATKVGAVDPQAASTGTLTTRAENEPLVPPERT